MTRHDRLPGPPGSGVYRNVDTGGRAREIALILEKPYIIGTDNRLYEGLPEGWTQIANSPTLSRIAVDGADDASSFIKDVAARCPDTKMVLGGFSQGAAVIDLVTVAAQPMFGFNNPLPPEVADHIAAVAVFRNPSNRAPPGP